MKMKLMMTLMALAVSVFSANSSAGSLTGDTTPAISVITPSALADQTLVISGDGLDGARLHIQTDSRAFYLDPWMSKSSRMLAVLPPDLEASVLTVRPEKNGLYGEAVYVNAAEVWWTYPSRVNAADATAVSVKLVGRNLKIDGVSPGVRLTGNGVEQDLNTTALNPYALEVTLPAGLSPGTYHLTAHNGSGGALGWSGPVAVVVESGIATTGLPVFNVSDYGAVADDDADDFPAISSAIAAAGAAGGGTVELGQGTYHLSAGLSLPQNVHLRGKGMGEHSGLNLETAVISGDYSALKPMLGMMNLTEIIRMEAPYASLSDLTVMNRHAGTSPGSINDGGVAGQMTRCSVRANAPDLVFENVRFVLADARPDVAFDSASALVLYDAALHVHSPGESNIRISGCDFRSVAVGLTFDHPQDQHIGTNACVAGTESVMISNCTFTGHSAFLYAYTPGSGTYRQDESYGVYNWNARKVVIEGGAFSGASRTEGYCLNRSIFVRNTSVRDMYIANNSMVDIGVWPGTGSALEAYLNDGGKVNEGEQILFHYRHPHGGYFDVLSAAMDSVTVDPDDPRNAGSTDNLGRAPDRRGSRILPHVGDNDHWLLYVAAGRGAGQVRTVTAQQDVSGDVELTVDEPWRVAPEENSAVLLFVANRHNIIFNNFVDAGAIHPAIKTGGAQFWLNAVENIIDGNQYANLSYGTVINSSFRNPCLWNLVQNTVSSNMSGFTGAGAMQPEFIHHSYYRSQTGEVEDPCATMDSDCHGWYSVGNVFRSNSGHGTSVGGFSGAHVGDWFSRNNLIELPDAGIMMDVMEHNTFTGVTNGFRYNKTCNDLLLRSNLLGSSGDTHYNKSQSGTPSDAILHVIAGPDGTQPFGYTRYAINATVEASFALPVSSALTRYILNGYSGTGDAPSGSSSNLTFTITQDSTLTWDWSTEHYLAISTNGVGVVTAGSGWYPEGTQLSLNAVPGDWSLFGFWSGDVREVQPSVESQNLTAYMSSHLTLTANFVDHDSLWDDFQTYGEWRYDLNGWFYDAAFPYIFHFDHGWLYLAPGSDFGSLSFYRFNRSGWNWIHNNWLEYYDFSTEAWVSMKKDD